MERETYQADGQNKQNKQDNQQLYSSDSYPDENQQGAGNSPTENEQTATNKSQGNQQQTQNDNQSENHYAPENNSLDSLENGGQEESENGGGLTNSPLDPLYLPYHSLDERNEEYATELTADDYNEPKNADEQQSNMQEQSNVNANSGFGWFAIVLSVLSFFWMPIVLGAAGIILGIVARNRGAQTLGNIAIVVGGLAIVARLLITPFS